MAVMLPNHRTVNLLLTSSTESATLRSSSPLRSRSAWLPDDGELIIATKAHDLRFLNRYLDRLPLDRLETILSTITDQPQHPLWNRAAASVMSKFPLLFPETKLTQVNRPGNWVTIKEITANTWASFYHAVRDRGYVGLLTLSFLQQKDKVPILYIPLSRSCRYFSVANLDVLVRYGQFDGNISLFAAEKLVETVRECRTDEAKQIFAIMARVSPRFDGNINVE